MGNDESNQGGGLAAPTDPQRRRLMQGAVAGAATLAATAAASQYAPAVVDTAVSMGRTAYARLTRTRGVAVIGAGIAGLACARELQRLGIAVTVYEADQRVGGRCHSVRGVFPGQVAERGAEFIGGSHHVMLGYAREFKLALADAAAPSSAGRYFFQGQAYSDAQVRAEFDAFVACIREDLGAFAAPTAAAHAEQARLFDLMTLDDYLVMYGAGGMLRGLIAAGCHAEFGAGPDEISALAFQRFVHGDARGKFGGGGATARYQVVDGIDRITSGLAASLATPVHLGHRLVAARRLSAGTVRLAFEAGGTLVQRDHDAVVLAVPVPLLRDVDLHATLELSPGQRQAIALGSMGDASKLLVGFRFPTWLARAGASGQVTSDLGRLQTTWESASASASTQGAVLSHLAGGRLGRVLRADTVQSDASAFLADLERAMPGASAAARRSRTGELLALCENWSVRPFSRGAYPCPRPGYFTHVAPHEATRAGNVLFAGDHASSFHEWQGFMEGAALSGLRAAAQAADHMLGR